MGRVKTFLAIALSAKGLTMLQFLLKTGGALVLAVTFVSCDKIKPPMPELQKPPTASGQADQQDRERKAFAQTAQKELDELRVAITDLRAKAKAANAQTQARLGEEVDKLEGELREVQQRLVELKSATVESWHQVTDSFGKSLDRLKARVESFRKNNA